MSPYLAERKGMNYNLNSVKPTGTRNQTNSLKNNHLLVVFLRAFASSLGSFQTFKRKMGAGDRILIPIKEKSIIMSPRVLETGYYYGLTGLET